MCWWKKARAAFTLQRIVNQRGLKVEKLWAPHAADYPHRRRELLIHTVKTITPEVISALPPLGRLGLKARAKLVMP